MPRPPKCRRVSFMPGATHFKPAGVPLRVLKEVRLSVEEIEAVRLKEQGAEKMNISRPTFQRVLTSARGKIADALLNGKAIRVEGGNFEMAPVRFRCATGHEWELPFDIAFNEQPRSCPVCNTTSVMPLQIFRGGWRSHGGGGRRRRGFGTD